MRVQVEEFDLADDSAWPSISTSTRSSARSERAGRHYLHLVDALLDDPSQAIDAVDMVLEDERETLLKMSTSDASRQRPSKPSSICSARPPTPDAPAVTCSARRCSIANW